MAKKEKATTRILDKIKKMYLNYGIDIEIMDDDEIERVSDFYVANKSKLEEDYIKSLELKGKFSEEELI
jgi:hypothetical protein